MLSFLLIIVLILVIIYLYYQLKQSQTKPTFPREELQSNESSFDNERHLIWAAKNNDWESQTASVIASLEQEVNELTSERDEAIREKKTTEQDLLATTNRLIKAKKPIVRLIS